MLQRFIVFGALHCRSALGAPSRSGHVEEARTVLRAPARSPLEIASLACRLLTELSWICKYAETPSSCSIPSTDVVITHHERIEYVTIRVQVPESMW
jgi:hypothetical protein